ncbi:hypothetical protein [Kitasatospora sp. NPDC058190]|uniref:hypothetical protein n=1 Tax=Kitasatospora sp. NPDC058190 TaxID=3346371 RepID=UPI0036DB3D4F
MRRVLEGIEVPEGVRAEIISGEILLSLSSDLTTNIIVASLADQIPHGKWHRWTKQSLSFPGDVGEPQPDYVTGRTTKFGEPVPVDLLGITLDTSEFQTYS